MATTPDFYAKRGETFSPRAILKGADGTPQDLTNAESVTLSMRPKGGGTPIYDHVACSFAADPSGAVEYDSPEVIDYEAGSYELEYDVTFPGGVVHTFPNGGPRGSADAFLLVKISEGAAEVAVP